eukprot:CAMPEP_0180675424 /NCGR_PEP_ID=MMETSP1037_2-20121125/66742_1 /TAXON_ID=632150 /ORGANISM="Azadinium spinosum, Strain 3D9" /LENGTH=926 /DNA_ID=CAMNT_0022704801 /DNA_START=60 /DNA_END=2840 /DNA_ORIENTATION=-
MQINQYTARVGTPRVVRVPSGQRSLSSERQANAQYPALCSSIPRNVVVQQSRPNGVPWLPLSSQNVNLPVQSQGPPSHAWSASQKPNSAQLLGSACPPGVSRTTSIDTPPMGAFEPRFNPESDMPPTEQMRGYTGHGQMQQPWSRSTTAETDERGNMAPTERCVKGDMTEMLLKRLEAAERRNETLMNNLLSVRQNESMTMSALMQHLKSPDAAMPRDLLQQSGKSTPRDVLQQSSRLNPEPKDVKDYENVVPGTAALFGTDPASTVIWQLACGNKRYVKGKMSGTHMLRSPELIDVLRSAPMMPASAKALVLSEARATAPPETIFDQEPGSLQVVRVCGFTCVAHDGVVGSLEYEIDKTQPKVLIVLGSSQNDAIESALRCAMKIAGRTDFPKPAHLGFGCKEEDLKLLESLVPAVTDTLLHIPTASFEQLSVIATKLNVWKTMEMLLTTSNMISEAIATGKLEMHGGYVNATTGQVEFMGQHPSQQALLADRPPDDVIRTAADPSFKLCESGQNPVAAVLGCADSRAPLEILFDMRPGDLFVLRTAGNSVFAGKNNIIGSAEYAISHLRTKLLVITGHTKCGAVTATVDSVRANKCSSTFPGSIGTVLADMKDIAVDTVSKMPDASVAEQVKAATESNVFATIEKIVQNSDIVKEAVMRGELHIQGAVYDIMTGCVKWLGQHPLLENIVGQSVPMHQWNVQRYARVPRPPRTNGAQKAIAALQDGNQRFVKSMPRGRDTGKVDDPFAIIVAGASIRVPVECIFDVNFGDVVVQRVTGNIAGFVGGALGSSLEYAVVRYMPQVLLVLGHSECHTIKAALKKVSGEEATTSGSSIIIDRVMVSAMRAVEQVSREKAATAAGRDVKIQQLATELNAFYTIEHILRSPIIRKAVRENCLELHACVLQERTGEVEFIGEHPRLAELLLD